MLRLTITGKALDLHPFVYDLSKQPQYDVEICSTELTENLQQEVSVQARLKFQPHDRKPLYVQLHTKNDQNIIIYFLDSSHVQVSPSVTYISGKVYDVFG